MHISTNADGTHQRLSPMCKKITSVMECTHQRLSPMCKIFAQLHNTCDFSLSTNQRLPITWNQKGPPCWLLHNHYIGLVFLEIWRRQTLFHWHDHNIKCLVGGFKPYTKRGQCLIHGFKALKALKALNVGWTGRRSKWLKILSLSRVLSIVLSK